MRLEIFFYDVGMRNAIMGIFSDIDTRPDKGALWENFCITERKKMMIAARDLSARQYFLRTYDGQEVDLVEEWEGATIKGEDIEMVD
jgi:uncharacterized protein